ncbi:unnamed protein product [Trichobilharzia regenti]|nr:unnamed protein product [Trichobilharzia regenti]
MVYFISAMCFYPKDEGNGIDSIGNFFYNATIGQCMKFTYKGAGGNDNNFDTEAECEQTCISSRYFKTSQVCFYSVCLRLHSFHVVC